MSAPASPAPPDSIGAILLNAARELEAAERALRAPPRELHVVELNTEAGWIPMPGDAYVEARDAEQCSHRSKLKTRVVVYVPRTP